MASGWRVAALLALAVVIGAGAFAVGRMTRDDESAAPPAATRIEESSVEVSIPPLAASRRVPALSEPSAEAAAPATSATPEVSGPSASEPSGSAPPSGGGGGGGSEAPVIVGGGTE